jgi:hypothetical protein
MMKTLLMISVVMRISTIIKAIMTIMKFKMNSLKKRNKTK